MGRRRRSKSNRKKARVTDAGGDHLTALPLELRARIASLLHFRQIVQLSVLSRPWRHIHHHAPIVKLYLYDFPDEEDSILAARVTLARRAQDAAESSVDTLRLAFAADDPRMRRHAGRIVALADAREIRIYAPYHHRDGATREAWALDLPPAARELEIVARAHLAPAITGGGTAGLSKLTLGGVVIREWPPLLPSLRTLDLDDVTAEAAFAPGSWCPRLEELDIFSSKIEHARVDIQNMPLLRFIGLDEVDVSPRGKHGSGGAPPFGELAVDAPALEELEVTCGSGSSHAGYRSFTLRAPRLRLLVWANQFAERVAIDVGRPGSVKFGTIQLSSIFWRGIERYREQMMRMLEGLLPDLLPESVADVARPYMTLEECDDSDDDEDETEEKLTCDIDALMRGI
ncbi:unnamed protein product [Urochloa decumbens]|uniref:F-box domain-containing protein n=1 Tax=Urochloa decumbens TaxID=240449 RepID=A0ABC9FNT4_9POAL